MRASISMVALVCLAVQCEGSADFARYQVIIDRMPFGEEPSPEALAAAAAKAVPPKDPFTKNLKMCAVTRNLGTGRLQVGLMDAATKKNYFLCVGDTEDGITLVEADYDGEKALLRKDGEEAWLGMSDVVTMVTVAQAQAPASEAQSAAAIAAARQARRAARAGKVEAPRLKGEALTKHLQDYQMDLIRAGGDKGPPLPLELTPEMDDQLVKEGVLPPLE